jgi:hypothetical protein
LCIRLGEDNGEADWDELSIKPPPSIYAAAVTGAANTSVALKQKKYLTIAKHVNTFLINSNEYCRKLGGETAERAEIAGSGSRYFSVFACI